MLAQHCFRVQELAQIAVRLWQRILRFHKLVGINISSYRAAV